MEMISFETLLKEELQEEIVRMESVKPVIEGLVKENSRLREELCETRAREAKRYEELRRESSLEIERLKRALDEQKGVEIRQEGLSETEETELERVQRRRGGRR